MYKIYPKSIETIKISEQIGEENINSVLLNEYFEKKVKNLKYIVYGHYIINACLVFDNDKVVDGFYMSCSSAEYENKSFEEWLKI
jgi:hypothetical protein